MASILPEMDMVADVSLVVRARQGDALAQNQLIQSWYKRIYNYAFKFFADHDLSMEVSQKTFMSMCRNLPGLQDTAAFKPWLYKIAVNCCRDELRREKARKSSPFSQTWNQDDDVSPSWESGGMEGNPESSYRQKELADLLQQALLMLSEEQREIVIMKEYEGLKFREIAETLNLSENTVKSRMYYGLNALRKILEKQHIKNEWL